MSDPTHDKYIALARQLIATIPPGRRILKTDCWNEAEGFGEFISPEHWVTYCEIDIPRVEKARLLHPTLDIVQGDIRNLPFDDATFSAIIDLSTIDHMQDFRPAIAQYARVLVPGGRMLIVSWFTVIADHEPEERGIISDRQYWFNFYSFTSCLRESFNIEEIVYFPEHSGVRWLMGFICKKVQTTS